MLSQTYRSFVNVAVLEWFMVLWPFFSALMTRSEAICLLINRVSRCFIFQLTVWYQRLLLIWIDLGYVKIANCRMSLLITKTIVPEVRSIQIAHLFLASSVRSPLRFAVWLLYITHWLAKVFFFLLCQLFLLSSHYTKAVKTSPR